MRLGPRQRLRVDRQGLEAACRAWWAAEHPGAQEFAALDTLTRTTVVEHVKVLMKRKRAEVPGDLVALEVLAVQTSQSAARAAGARARRETLRALPTKTVLAMLHLARINGHVSVLANGQAATWWGDDGAPPRYQVPELKAELATREHVPNAAERREARKRRAAAGRSNRARPPRR